MTDEPYADTGTADLGEEIAAAFRRFREDWQRTLGAITFTWPASASESGYRGRRAGWYPRRPRRAPRGVQRRHEALYAGQAGDFAPDCLSCGGEMGPFATTGWICRSCGTTSGATR